MRRLLCLIVSLLFTTGLSAALREGNLSVIITADAVTITGFASGSPVAVLGVTIDSANQMARTTPYQEVLVEGAKGGEIVVPLARSGAVPVSSLWIAVDTVTGNWGAGSPTELKEFNISAGALRRNGGRSDKFEVLADYLLALLVRPRGGVWAFSGFEGGSADGDRTSNGRIEIESLALTSLGLKLDPPARLAEGDVVVILDPRLLRYHVREIGR